MRMKKGNSTVNALQGTAASVLLISAIAAGPAGATTMGPDTFGYTAADEDEASVDYAWVDMSAGTDMVGDLGDTDISAAIPLGFTFVFYGREYTEAYVDSDGFVVFEAIDPSTVDYLTLACEQPADDTLDSWISFHAWDFDPSDATACTDCHVWVASGGMAPNRWWGVTFWNVPDNLIGATAIKAQVILYEGTNEIRAQIEESHAFSTFWYTVLAIESEGNLSGMTFTDCSTLDGTHAGQAVVFTPPVGRIRALEYESKGWGQAGDTVTHEFSLWNLEAADAIMSVTISGGSWTTTPSATSIDVAAGGTSTLTIDVDLPASAGPGTGDRSTITLTPAVGAPIDLAVTTSVQDPPLEWQVVTDMPYWVYLPSVATVGDTIYLIGGMESTSPVPGPATDMLQALDTSTMTWDDSVWGSLSFVPPNGHPVKGQGACAMDGKIYIAGGDYGSDGSTPPAFDGLFIYDVATDTWSEGATMPAGRGGLAVVCDEPHHKLYAVGGWPWTDVGHWYMGSDDLWSYDAGTDTWDDTLSRHPLPVAMATASMVEDGMFLVAGGHIGEQEPSVRTFTYTIATDTWEESGELSDTRFEHAAVLLQPDRMCLLGGTTPDYYTLASWECWRDGVWTPMPTDMPEPRYVFAAGSVGETTYVMGGFTSHAWDPARTHTTSCPALPVEPASGHRDRRSRGRPCRLGR